MFENIFKKATPLKKEQHKINFPAAKLSRLQKERKIYGGLGIDDGMKGYHSSTLEPMTELLAPTGLAVFNKMRKNDPVVGGIILLLESVIKRLDMSIYGDNADFVKNMLENMRTPFQQILAEIASAFTFGFYLGEKIWQYKDGIMSLIDIEPRYQTTLDYINNEQGLVGQTTAGGLYSIPYEKTLHVVFINDNRSPYGISILRHLYKPYYYKLSIEAAEALGIDRDLGGLPIMTAPEGFDFTAADSGSPNYDPNTAATLEWAIQLVSSVRRDQQQGVVKPFGWKFELARGENRSSVPTSDILARYNTEMAAGVIANFMALGAFASTNNSNAQLHANNFIGACEAYARAITSCLQQQVVNQICKYNRIEEPPTISLAVRHHNSLKDIGSFLATLVDKGVIHATESIEKSILTLASLPYNEEEAERQRQEITNQKAQKPETEGGEDA